MIEREKLSNPKAATKTLFYMVLILFSFFMIIPFLWMISTSLKLNQYVLSIPPRLIPEKITITNYLRLTEIFPMTRIVFNSLFVAVTMTTGQVFVSSMAAYAFARMKFRGKSAIFLLYLATLMIPFQVIITPLFILMRYLRWTNTYQALIFPGIFNAFGTFLLRQFLLPLPRDLEESAFLDGANHFMVYWRIILPLAKPALATLAVLAYMEAWNSFLWPLMVIRDTGRMTLPVGLATLHGRYLTEWNLVMAGAVITVVPMIIVFLLAQKYFVKGIAQSGLKQ
ncbi:MAG: carbohydrate ABC transporter permease [Spirochaetes bacterium]|nr:MAG: carbohydrate ABC transporter permease [Spirochaetota bacterium]